MACDNCEWEDAAERAENVADALPSWKSKSREFFQSVSETILEKKHATEKQLDVIEKAEGELE